MATSKKKTTSKPSTSSTYESMIKKLGIHPSEVENGQTVRRAVLINSVSEYKDLFAGNIAGPTRKAHTQNLKNKFPEAFKSKKEADLMHRLSAHIYGDYPLSTSDVALSAKHFPLKIMVTTAKSETISTPVTYGPSASPVALLYDTLTFSGAGSITTENTILTLNATNIVVGKLSGGKPYLINVLGVKGAPVNPGTNGTSYPNQAKNGSNASTPAPGICTGATAPGVGHNGLNGGDATSDGEPGNPGKPSLHASINITNQLTGMLSLYTKSGDGGHGGKGGNGGQGQQGGNGGNGCNTGCECTDGANGGNGGNGGNGSNGGDGGNAVDGNDIFITIPNKFVQQIITGKDTATPGLGGGLGAQGGVAKPGVGGTTGHKHCSDGSPGTQGTYAGKPGAKGKDGTQNGAPGNFHLN